MKYVIHSFIFYFLSGFDINKLMLYSFLLLHQKKTCMDICQSNRRTSRVKKKKIWNQLNCPVRKEKLI